MNQQAKIFRVASIGLFLLCLIMPAYSAEGKNYYGWFLLLAGFYALPSGELSWLANIALFTSWWTLRFNSRALTLMFAVSAFLLAMSFMRHDTIWVYNWSGGQAKFQLKLGYYIWLMSMAFAAAPALRIVKQGADADST